MIKDLKHRNLYWKKHTRFWFWQVCLQILFLAITYLCSVKYILFSWQKTFKNLNPVLFFYGKNMQNSFFLFIFSTNISFHLINFICILNLHKALLKLEHVTINTINYITIIPFHFLKHFANFFLLIIFCRNSFFYVLGFIVLLDLNKNDIKSNMPKF